MSLHPRCHVDTLLREPDPDVLGWPVQLWHLLEKDDEPAYRAFLDSCIQTRELLSEVDNLGAWLDERTRNLDAPGRTILARGAGRSDQPMERARAPRTSAATKSSPKSPPKLMPGEELRRRCGAVPEPGRLR